MPSTANSQIQGHFKGFDGTTLFYQSWNVGNPKGTLVVTHGQAEHSGCYQLFARGMNSFGWNVLAWDLRGHGLSEGKRGYAGSVEDYAHDLKIFAEILKDNNLIRGPAFLVSHSLGGLITLRSLLDYGGMGFKAVALSSPALGLAIEVPWLKDFAAKVLYRVFPSLTLNNEVKFEQLSQDKEVCRSYGSDPLRHDRISIGLYLDILKNFSNVYSRASEITIPILMQLAGDDLIASTKSSEQFFQKLSSKQKKLKIYDGLYHEIFNEVKRQEVYNDLNHFLQSQC